MHLLETINLKGFRSIKQLENFKLAPITVLIGANGSGKSNLIGFFRMLNYVRHGGLQRFVLDAGGASNVLHFGPARTRFLDANLVFRSIAGSHAYGFELRFAYVDRLVFSSEEVEFKRDGTDHPEPMLIKNFDPEESGLNRETDPARKQAVEFILEFLEKMRVFHFYDTSMTSRMRNHSNETFAPYLQFDGGNLAPVLLRLQTEFPANYRRVVAGVNTVFPELKDFQLDPVAGSGNGMLLRWRPTSNPTEVFGPSHLSDGTLRMIALVTLFNLPEEMAPWMIVLDEPELGLHPAAEAYLASLIRSASTHTQVLISTQSATLVDHFKPSEVVVTEIHDGASTFHRLEEDKLKRWLKRYTLGEAWRKNVFGGRPE